MDIAGLIFEFFFLGVGILTYAFARGFLTPPNKDIQKSAEEFRQRNGGWLRLLGIAIIAIMTLNIALHLKMMFDL